MANYVGPIASDREMLGYLFGRFHRWGPGVISIVIALLVAALSKSSRISPKTLLNIGLAFQVVISFGIAASEYSEIYAPVQYRPGEFGGVGLSWVAVWMLLFTVTIPTAPRKALVAAIASASAVPITFGLSMRLGPGFAIPVTPADFFFGLVFPYMLIVLMAYVGARVVYKLGTDVSRAREMGSYRLTERLGQGGMGEVWKAKHRMLCRPAAIKLINPQVLGDANGGAQRTILQRFEREAQATASMRSPHTIELYDFGVTSDGTFYYVMELLDGYDLESLVQQFGPVPPERAIYLLRQICHSLAEAHEHDLIHRDIKPANVYVCRYGREFDFVKVLDFGLVKVRTDSGEDDVKLTAGNFAGGTPAYIAPEQVLDGVVDGRTDIYAVGCVAYWLLTGRLVFDGDTPMKMITDHVHMPPTPPSERAEQKIPERLERIILACLEKDPDRRPASADVLSEALTASGTDVAWTTERAREWWESHRSPQT